MTKLQTTNYKLPYPQDALGGELGLTSFDISKSLGVLHGHVVQKIKRLYRKEAIKNCELFKGSQLCTVSEKANRNIESFSVNTNFAKYIVATWKNETGLGYFAYLLKCEQIAETQLPKLLKENENLVTKINLLLKNKTKKIKKQNEKMIRIPIFVERTDIFGDKQEYVEYIYKPYSEATTIEKATDKLRHIRKVVAGLGKVQDLILDKSMVVPDPSLRLIKGGKGKE